MRAQNKMTSKFYCTVRRMIYLDRCPPIILSSAEYMYCTIYNQTHDALHYVCTSDFDAFACFFLKCKNVQYQLYNMKDEIPWCAHVIT